MVGAKNKGRRNIGSGVKKVTRFPTTNAAIITALRPPAVKTEHLGITVLVNHRKKTQNTERSSINLGESKIPVVNGPKLFTTKHANGNIL